MEAKKYLSELLIYRELYDTDTTELERLRELSIGIVTSTADGVYSSTPTGERVPALVAKIIDLEAEIIKEIAEIINFESDVRKKITALSDKRHRLILQKKYVNGETLEEIACEMSFTERYVRMLHSKAIEEFERLIEAEEEDKSNGRLQGEFNRV
jgi:DNA-directed RNA polymerase specialized sigma subunit